MSRRLPGLTSAVWSGWSCWTRAVHVHLLQGTQQPSAGVPWQDSRAQLHTEPLVDVAANDQPSDQAHAPKKKDQAFVDKARLEVAAGHGGAGCVSIWKSSGKGKFQPADGGNGGRGGDVVVEACPRTRSLRALRHLQRADPGHRGRKQRKVGMRGADCVLRVPLGTVVYKLPRRASQLDDDGWQRSFLQACAPAMALQGHSAVLNGAGDGGDGEALGGGWGGENGEVEQGSCEQLLADLVEPGQRVVVVRGGEGGRGNAAFRTGRNRPASRESEPGQLGEEAVLRLEMKVLADIGLVGAPNAGKSTLLRALSAAQPAVAAYPFTTLRPQLGALRADGPAGNVVVVADIPGLIAGAAANRGLGHAFLRHVERTRLLAYVVDLSGGMHGDVGPRAWDQLAMLQEELRLFSPALLARPSLVVANKVDKWPDGRGVATTLRALRRRTHLPVLPVSAQQRQGTETLRACLLGCRHPAVVSDEAVSTPAHCLGYCMGVAEQMRGDQQLSRPSLAAAL